MIRPDLAEFERAVLHAATAIHCRAMARAIRSGKTHVFGKTASDYYKQARQLERDVRITADRAIDEAQGATSC